MRVDALLLGFDSLEQFRSGIDLLDKVITRNPEDHVIAVKKQPTCQR